MRKICLSYKIRVLVILVIVSLLLVSCTQYRKFKCDVIEDFLEELSDKYDYITDTDVYRTQGPIEIRIHFDSQENTAFDEIIHEDIKAFIWQVNVQDQIITDYDENLLEGANYPRITVKFVDSNEVQSHFIATPDKFVDYKRGNERQNRYLGWSDPFYYKKNR